MYCFIKNRFWYAAVASVLAGGIIIFLDVIYASETWFYPNKSTWIVSTMMCTAALALYLWPRADLRTRKRMAITGFLIGLITLSVMSLAYGSTQTTVILAEGAPADWRYKIAFAFLFFISTLFETVFAPLWLGILASLFVETKNKS